LCTPRKNPKPAPTQYSIDRSSIEQLPEDSNVMPKHVGDIIHNYF
jgi:hypothetical protein